MVYVNGLAPKTPSMATIKADPDPAPEPAPPPTSSPPTFPPSTYPLPTSSPPTSPPPTSPPSTSPPPTSPPPTSPPPTSPPPTSPPPTSPQSTSPPPTSPPPTSPPAEVCPAEIDDPVKLEIIKRLEELEPELDNMTEIAEPFLGIPLICMQESTDMELCYRLDPLVDLLSDAHFEKDYVGMAEWIGLENVYIKYLTRTESRWKTTDVLAKWSTLEEEPLPTLGNLQKCLCGEGGIDRPDVITDLATKINKDAFKWEMGKYRANHTPPDNRDVSWQLTRQDVITGKRTFYTCCLIYADEDQGTASMITNLFKAVKKEAIFFNPQFDLKVGKYVQETTASVIEERCGGKVIFVISEYFFASPVCQFTVQFAKGLDIVITGKITYYTACLVYADEDEGMAEVINKLYTRVYPRATFFRPQFDMKRGRYELSTTGAVIQERCGGKAIFILSEYFFASDVCQFAVNFTAAVCKGAGVGNLIPFHLTSKSEHVPAVLKGIAGIRWFRKGTRKFSWQMITDTILSQEMQDEEIKGLYERIYQLLDDNPCTYLCEAPYDEDTAPPGEPIKVIEPEGISQFLEEQNRAFQQRLAPPPVKLSRIKKFQQTLSTIQKRIHKSFSPKDTSKSSCEEKKDDDIETLYQRVPDSKKASKTSQRIRKSKSKGTSRFREGRLAGFLSRFGKSSSSPSLLISEQGTSCDSVAEQADSEMGADQHSNATEDFELVDWSSVDDNASVASESMKSVRDSLEDSCQLQVSSDLSRIAFKKNSSHRAVCPTSLSVTESTVVETCPPPANPPVPFYSSTPEGRTPIVDACEDCLGLSSECLGLDNEGWNKDLETLTDESAIKGDKQAPDTDTVAVETGTCANDNGKVADEVCDKVMSENLDTQARSQNTCDNSNLPDFDHRVLEEADSDTCTSSGCVSSKKKERYYVNSSGQKCSSSEYTDSGSSMEVEVQSKKVDREPAEHDEVEVYV